MLDLLIVIAFVAYAVTVGFRARRKASRNLQEYFLAGRTIRGWRAGLSMAATQFAADTPLLFAGLIATAGIFLCWRLWIYGIAFLLMGFVFSEGWRRAGVLTDAELTEIRYSGRGVLALRILKALYYGTVINCVVMAMVLVAATRIAEIFLPWHEWLPGGIYGGVLGFIEMTGLDLGGSTTGLEHAVAAANNFISILVILAFTALYSTTGGLRSVIATDVVQFTLAMAGTLVYAFVLVDRVGGLGALTDGVVSLYGQDRAEAMLSFAPPVGTVALSFLVIVGFQWFFQMNSDGTGYLAQRSMACTTDRDARVAGVLFAWVQVIARSVIWLVIGVGLLVVYPFTPADAASEGFAAGREVLFATGIDELLPPGIRGLMLTGLLAALASTIDTHLNWGASYWSNDIYRRLVCDKWLRRKPKSRELVAVARLSNLLILVISLTIMANLGSIQKAWFVSLLFGAGMGSVLVLRWLWERINLFSEVAAIVASLIVAPVLLVLTNVQWIHLGVMALVSTVCAVGITYFTPPTRRDVLNEFYRRVKPAGGWGQAAEETGDDPKAPAKKLRAALATTALASLSLFLTLVGLGRFLVGSPGGFSHVPWLCTLAGLFLVPIWWRRAFHGHR